MPTITEIFIMIRKDGKFNWRVAFSDGTAAAGVKEDFAMAWRRVRENVTLTETDDGR